MTTLIVGVEEAGAKLGLSRSALLERAYKGEIPSFKLGRRRMFSVERLERWVREMAGEPDEDEGDIPTWDEIGRQGDLDVRRALGQGMRRKGQR